MTLLVGKTYNPTTAVNKATTALLPMTALDTTNLRLSFTVPASGNVVVQMQGVLHGATAVPSVLLGVMQGATIVGAWAPDCPVSAAAATSLSVCKTIGLVTGLTPGATLTWDAAYSVETLVASTGLKYGGPNDSTANNAFGGFIFGIYSAT